MVKAYIDYGSMTEEIATFDSEELYQSCVPALEAYVEKHKGTLVESVVTIPEVEDLEEIEMKPLQEWHKENMYTREAFESLVHTGAITENDGVSMWATETEISNLEYFFDHAHLISPTFTHIVHFGK